MFQRQSWGKYPPEHVVRFVAQKFYAVRERSSVRLLDLGSGPGASTWFMAREGFAVAAIDGSASAIQQLTERLAREGLRAEARVGDLQPLPWADGTFDGVLDNAALYCNRRAFIRAAIGEVERVLKPGGWFLSASFSDRTWGYGRGRLVEPGGYSEIDEGPLAHKGFAAFFGRAELDDLYAVFAEPSVERVVWTLEQGERQIEMWLVTCRKRP